MTTQVFYDELRNCFLDIRNSNDAKVFVMRLTLEDFFNYIIGTTEADEKLNFANAQSVWYESVSNYRLNREVTYIRQEMNKVVHGQRKNISDETLRAFYEYSVRLVNLITGDMPDVSTLAAYGHVDEAYLASLNTLQKDAVLASDRIVYVNAGPGTGKTRMLVYKILDLLIKDKDKAKIVSMSYTRSSASSLSAKIADEGSKLNVIRFNSPYSGTIHSYSLNSLKAFYKSKGLLFDYIIADESELEELADDIYYSTDCIYQREIILDGLCRPDSIQDERLKKILEDTKKVYKRISVGEILHLYLKTLQENEEFIEWVTNNVNYILVDEAQDLSYINYQIFDTLIEKIPNLKLFLVGDPRQNIFGFLGGSYKHLDAFLSKHQAISSIKHLNSTYRCPKCIVDFTNSLVFDDCANIQITSIQDKAGRIEVYEYDDEYQEANEIVRHILNVREKGSVAILTPKLKQVSKIVDRLNETGIPFVVYGGAHSVKPHIMAFVYLNRIAETNASSLGPMNALCEKFNLPKHRNVYDFLNTDIGIEVSRLYKNYIHKNISYLELCRNFVKICKQYFSGDAIDNDYKLLYESVIKNSDTPSSFGKLFKSYKGVFMSLEMEYKSTGNNGKPITISTMHSAKGLEWDYVILPSMCDSFFPGTNVSDEVDCETKNESLNSNLKLMYVAVTRSKGDLLITYPGYLRDSQKYTRPSRFLKNILL